MWPRKLGPFHKRAAWPKLIITSLSNFKRRRKNRRVGYKWALSLSWPIRYTYLDHVTFSNISFACTYEMSLPYLQITCFRENRGYGYGNNYGFSYDYDHDYCDGDGDGDGDSDGNEMVMMMVMMMITVAIMILWL